jgi:hypothetical protein
MAVAIGLEGFAITTARITLGSKPTEITVLVVLAGEPFANTRAVANRRLSLYVSLASRAPPLSRLPIGVTTGSGEQIPS